MLKDEYPALWQFLGAYLHQDWLEEYESTDDALRDFVAGSPELAVTLPREVEHLLATTTADAAVEDILVRLGSFVVPSRAGENPREWLRGLQVEAQRLVQPRG